MTTAVRISAGPARLLPPVLPVLLLLPAVLLAPVAPGRETGVLYRVDTPEFAVVDGFSCAGSTCSVDVAGRVLTIRAGVLEPCLATYDGRPVGCRPSAEYGPAEPWVLIDSLGVPPERAPSAPWWRDAIDRQWTLWWIGGALVLALVVGLATALLYRGPRLPHGDRLRQTVLTGVAAWLAPAAAVLLVEPGGRASLAGFALVAPHVVLLPVAVVTWWQHLASGPQSGRLRGRLGQAAVASVATALYVLGGVLCLAMAAGLPD